MAKIMSKVILFNFLPNHEKIRITTRLLIEEYKNTLMITSKNTTLILMIRTRLVAGLLMKVEWKYPEHGKTRRSCEQ